MKLKAKHFDLGQLIVTRNVNDHIAEKLGFAKFVSNCIKRHAAGDWGNLCNEDKAENDYALDKYLRIFSSYEDEVCPRIWIITEADRSVTTVLFPEDY